MSDKTECPGCQSYTSSVLQAFDEGNDCPYCGLPASAAFAVDQARRSKADADLTERYAQAEMRAQRAERQNALLKAALLHVRAALDEAMPTVED